MRLRSSPACCSRPTGCRRPAAGRGDRAAQRGEEGRAVGDGPSDRGADRRRHDRPLRAPARPRRTPGGHLRQRGSAADDPPRHDRPRVICRGRPARAREPGQPAAGPHRRPGGGAVTLEQATPVLLCSDIERTAAWLRDAVGFETELHGDPPNFLIGKRDGQRIMYALSTKRIVPNWHVVENMWNVYLRTDDVDDL